MQEEASRNEFGPNGFEPNSSIKEFIDIMKGSLQFQAIVAEANDIIPKANLVEFRRILMGHFAGAVFQRLAYHYLNSMFSSRRLVDSEESLLLYEGLHPDAVRSIKPFGLSTLQGISVPDILILKPQKNRRRVAYVCEATLTTAHLRSKETGLRRSRKKFPYLFRGARLLVLTPSDLVVFPSLNSDFRHEPLPISRPEFGRFINSIIN